MKVAIACTAAEEMEVDQLSDFQGGLKTISQVNIDKLKHAIIKYGFSAPVFIWNAPGGENFILDGHQRIKALKDLRGEGWEIPPVPVARVEAEGEKEAREKLLHIASQYGTVSSRGLLDFVDVSDIALSDLDIRLSTGELKLSNLSPAEETNEDDEVWDPTDEVLPGDIWELGPHRIICGDSTDPKVISRLTRGVMADLYLTDPPYNVSIGVEDIKEAKARNRRTDKKIVLNDALSDNDFFRFLFTLFLSAKEVMKPGASFYIFHADSVGLAFRSAAARAGFPVRQCLIWAKNVLVMGRQDYQWRHEPILYGWNPGAKHVWNGGRKQTTILEYDRPSRSAEHPTMKPVSILQDLIQNSSPEGGYVFDSCLGSGSTLVASEKTGRVCYGAEISPVYCAVIIERFRRWTEENGRKYSIRKVRGKKNG